MDNNMKLYYDYTLSTLGQLYYKTVTAQLSDIKGKDILDFGSGFGFVSDFLGKDNTVTALEQDSVMIDYAINTSGYNQIKGNLDYLKTLADNSFDVITCHLVLEFVDNPKEILAELIRLTRKDGFISLIRHNRNGRIIQAVVQDYDLTEADSLLNNGYSFSSAFGDIKYYDNAQLLGWADNGINISKISGIRTLASLHNSSTVNNPNWLQDMLPLEIALSTKEDFIPIAYFNHLRLVKI